MEPPSTFIGKFVAMVDTRFSPRRFGWPKLQCMPVKTIRLPASHYYTNVGEVFETLYSIFEKEGIELHEVFPAYRFHEGEEHLERTMTLVMITGPLDESPRFANMPSASTPMPPAGPQQSLPASRGHVTGLAIRLLRKIHQLCDQLGLGLRLEIIDENAWRGGTTLPVKAGDPVVRDWNKTSFDIYQYLRKVEMERNLSWSSVDLLHRGSETDYPLTTVLGTPDADDDYWWTEGVQQIRRLTNGKFQIEVAFVQDMEMTTSPDTELNGSETTIVSMQGYDRPCTMGASISERDQQPGGTLGGYVALQCSDGPMRHVGLTNHQVGVSAELETVIGKYSSTGPDHEELRNRKRMFVSPSEREHVEKGAMTTKNRQCLQDLMRGCVDQLGGLVCGIIPEKPPVHTQANLVRILSEYQAKILQFDHDLLRMSTVDRTIGHLAASSGRRSRLEWYPHSKNASRSHGNSLDWLVDWALIEVSSASVVENLTSESPRGSAILNGRRPQEYTMLDLCNNYEVAFHGRTSGWVFGRVNAAESLINEKRKRRKATRRRSRRAISPRTMAAPKTTPHTV